MTREDAGVRSMVMFGIAMLAAQFAFLFLCLTVLLFLEGVFYYPVPQAGAHALERAPIMAAVISAVITGAHFVRVHRTQRITAASLRSVHRVTFSSAEAAEQGDHALESIRSMPGVRGLTLYRSDSWEIDMGASVRWFARITVSVARESIVLEAAPRHPLLFPGSPPRMKKIASLISDIQSNLSRRA
ncbi:hypothetical protein GCM10022403_080130 [Streptomyces coacervatus]|uniref:Uncharacterized protein n=2 Tax=Streptomyces coacervatus TaxID=647381 RepID=A0ABP7J6M6_9ACTN